MKNLTVRIVLFILGLIVGGATFAQGNDNNHIEGTMVPSPEAAAFAKNVDIPIGHYTGASSSSVPIYTLTEGKVSLPISLNYNNSGIRVAETASWVGLGWNLNYGGIISRIVRGVEDDIENRGYIDVASVLDGADFNELNSVGARNNLSIDSEPDIFTFSAGPYSGKFFFDGSSPNEVVMVEQQDIKIIPHWSTSTVKRLSGFTVITPNGTKYIFGSQPDLPGVNFTVGTITNNRSIDQTNYNFSSWNLIEVSSYDDVSKISFNYVSELYDYYVPAGASLSWGQRPNATSSGLIPPSYDDPLNSGHYRMEVDGVRLTRIESSNTTIDFIPGARRTDIGAQIQDPFSLGEIVVSTGSQGEYCKEFIFEYDYFGTANPSSSLSGTRTRLKLLSLEERACNDMSLSIPKHQFTYNDHPLFKMPNRLSKRIDHWGFHNGANGNDNLGILCPPSVPFGPYSSYCTADRETNEEAMLIGSLKRHTFPTGGYREYVLEANSVLKTIENVSTSIPHTLKDNDCRTTQLDGANCCGRNFDSKLITITQGILDANKYRIKVERPIFDQGNPICGYNIYTSIKVRNAAGDIIGSTPEDFQNRFHELPFEHNYDLNDLFDFVLGESYTFEFETYNSGSEFSLFSQVTTTTPENYNVGGLRTKEVILYDPVANVEIKKEFTYLNESGYSSGLLAANPIYFYSISNPDPNDVSSLDITNNSIWDFHYYKDHSVTQLADNSGYHITYTHVQESQNGVGETHYEFMNSPPQQQSYGFPRAPSRYDFFRGLLLKKTAYSEGGANLNNIISESEYEYNVEIEVQPNKAYSLFYMPIVENCGGVNGGPDQCKLRLRYFYNIDFGFAELTRETTTTDGVTIVQEHKYESDDGYRYKTEQSIINSDGDLYTTKLFYPEDYDDLVYREMEELNILTPIRTEKFADGQKVDANETRWSLFNTIPYPSEFWREELTAQSMGSFAGNWERQAKIYEYLNGWPTRYQRDGGWGFEEFDWSTNGLIQEKRYIPNNPSSPTLVWGYEYEDGTSLVKKITNIDGQFVTYQYDELMRFNRSSARNGKVISTVDYSYQGQDPNRPQNYQKNTTVFTPSDGSTLVNLTTYQYFDGLGRGIQTVKQGYSDNNLDVATAMKYDAIGRVWKSFDPVEITDELNDGNYFPINEVNFPDYTETEYYSDPLSRTFKVTAPSWHPIETAYGTNETNSVTDPATGFMYPENSLIKQEIKDSDGRITQVFADKLGRKILTRQIDVDGTTILTDTYTSYDLKGRVQKVFPPGASNSTPGLIYSYLYDGADNVLEKKMPDQGEFTYVYDDRDLPVAMSNASVPTPFDFVGSVYDDYGQLIVQGFVDDALSSNFTIEPGNELIRNTYGTTGTSINKITEAKVRVLTGTASSEGLGDWITTINTYDPENGRLVNSTGNSYFNLTAGSEITDFTYDEADNITKTIYQHAKTGTDISLVSVSETLVDHSGRPKANFHQLTVDGVQNPRTKTGEMYYTAKDQMSIRKIGEAGSGFLQEVNYTYLPNGFLSKINDPTMSTGNDLFSLELRYDSPANGTAQRNGNISSSIAKVMGGTYFSYDYSYDGLNRLTGAAYKDIQNNSSGQYSTSYSYDERGNIGSIIRSGLYADAGGPLPVFGQIDNLDFVYVGNGNNSNRLQRVDDTAPQSDRENGFNALTTNDYMYDTQGNMTYDPSKDLTITYNYLDLPFLFEFASTAQIVNTYLADGTKVRETKKDDKQDEVSRRDYVGPIQYLTIDDVSSIAFVNHADGRIVQELVCDDLYITGNISGTKVYDGKTIESDANILDGADIDYNGESISLEDGFSVAQTATFSADNTPCTGTLIGKWTYQYYITDHLGNNRVLFSDQNNDGTVAANEILQQNHYYPFGMEMDGGWNQGAAVEQRYRYNGIEHSEELGLDLAVFRSYDPAIGRWLQVDPKAEAFTWASPYNGMLNNPISNIDPLGDTTRVYNLAGELQRTINDSHINQEHYLGTTALNLLNGSGVGSDMNLAGSLARVLSSFFVGHNTKQDMSTIFANSESENLERFFLLVTGTGSKELRAVDISEKGSRIRTQRKVELKSESVLRGLTPEGNTLIGLGHTHPSSALNPGSEFFWGLRQPSSSVDFDNHLGLELPYPNIVASPTGYTLYSNRKIWYGSKTRGVMAPSNYGQHLSWLRSVILDDDVRN
ncbi:RHS repeat domain-containing protein [Neolewinella agarilytica]|uniref:RHS repeat-associated core domain-containing protein n=1 Tax=Neolewinella agarilytica TaxID=478744 RepID=A0A1H9M7V3_9BACT|nr:DUF6443 domain-containing protein [Neolewinella agarilytica]SER19774.1 RHS repeat-associated core domain-containing protein [Neolewinella agarilytica]